MTMANADLNIDVVDFLHREAEVLDDNLLDDWLAMLDPEVRYVMPTAAVLQPPRTPEERRGRLDRRWGTSTNQAGPDLRFSLYDDDYAALNMRVRRLDTGMAHAELPESIVTRIVTNITVGPDPDREDLLRVRSKIVVHQMRHENNQSVFFGSRWDKLRRSDAGLRLLRRHVELAHPVLPRTLSTFF